MSETIEVNKKALKEILTALNKNTSTHIMELLCLRGFDEKCPITILTKEYNANVNKSTTPTT